MQRLQVTVWESAWPSLGQTIFPSLLPLAMVGILFCYLNYPAFCYVLKVVCAVDCSALGPLSSLPLGLAPRPFQARWSGGGNIPGRCFPHLVIVFLS